MNRSPSTRCVWSAGQKNTSLKRCKLMKASARMHRANGIDSSRRSLEHLTYRTMIYVAINGLTRVNLSGFDTTFQSTMKTTKAIHNAIQEDKDRVGRYSWPIRCCIFSFMVWYAFMIVCSLITISVVSAFGLLTRDAIVVESVSTMTLDSIGC